MPKFNLELFKTLVLNFVYIQSKRRKLGTFILFQKCQFVYKNKVNSPPIRQYPSFSIFGHVTCQVTIIERQAQENPKFYFLGKIIFVLGLLAKDIVNHSYAPNTPLTEALNSLRYFFGRKLSAQKVVAYNSGQNTAHVHGQKYTEYC